MRALRNIFARDGLRILTYHRVLEAEDELRPGEITLAAFDVHCSVLARWFNVLPLGEAWRRTLAGTLPPRAVAITFDDGYADNVELALPALQRHGLTATFFIATGYLDGGRMWNDSIIESARHAPASLDLSDLGVGVVEFKGNGARGAAVDKLIKAWKHLPPEEREARVNVLVERIGAAPPDDLMMRSDQVCTLATSGMSIGAHTVTHPILRKIGDADAAEEMRASRATLEALTGAPVELFAYPNGRLGDDYELRHAALARDQGFLLAVATDPGVAGRDSDPFRLPRFGPWAEAAWRFGARLLDLQ
jgi:peptidoglycan/xylan/chitin deacetylase (PgdA/CDA1 family)